MKSGCKLPGVMTFGRFQQKNDIEVLFLIHMHGRMVKMLLHKLSKLALAYLFAHVLFNSCISCFVPIRDKLLWTFWIDYEMLLIARLLNDCNPVIFTRAGKLIDV